MLMQNPTKKIATGTAVLAAAALTLTGCSLFQAAELDVSKGAYVHAPAGDTAELFTLTVDGSDVEVTRLACDSGASAIDPRDTAFGTLGEVADGAAPLKWLEPGAFGSDKKAKLEVLSDGDMLKIGKSTFFASEGSQGAALTKQFGDDCKAGPAEADDSSKPGSGDDNPDDATKSNQVSLAPEAGTQYLTAVSGFSPLLESWVVDQAAGVASYTRYSCTGAVDSTGTGAIVEDAKGYQITWDGEPPLLYVKGQTDTLNVTERSLQAGGQVATADVNAEMAKFTELCGKAGKDVADFVF